MASVRLDILVAKGVLISSVIKLPDIVRPYSAITKFWKIPSYAILYQCLESSVSAIIEGVNVVVLEAEIFRSGCRL